MTLAHAISRQPEAVTASYATVDGTALAPGDHVAASGTVTFPAGQPAQTAAIAVNGDGVVEADETRVDRGWEGEYAPEYLVEPEHIREGAPHSARSWEV